MFATHRLTTFAGTALLAGALGLAAAATAGTAGAVSSVDDAFLNDITSEGISYDTPKGAIRNAHYVCNSLDDGADPVDLGQEILDNTDLTTHQAAVFVVASVNAYCPEYTGYFE
jgi:Protein of unknown function (DUF732)